VTGPRFDDEGARLTSFGGSVDVRCPTCDHRAVVKSSAGTPARVTCPNCSFAADEGPHSWLGPVKGRIHVRCRRCHRLVVRNFPGPKQPHPVTITCECGHEFSEEIRWRNIVEGPSDPTFGLPLWLCLPFRGDVLWAYNEAHLRFLRTYIAADLRHREPNQNGSMASRLPPWMKASKNRAALLTAIRKLESRARTTAPSQ
jgi:hypothetical protein